MPRHNFIQRIVPVFIKKPGETVGQVGIPEIPEKGGAELCRFENLAELHLE